MLTFSNIALALLTCAVVLFVLPACVYLCVKLGRAAWLRAETIYTQSNPTQPKTKDTSHGPRN